MNTGLKFEISSSSSDDMEKLGEQLGQRLSGGELIELIGDVGSGKTTFVRGLARGMGSHDVVQSPTFTISRIYQGPSFTLHHFDFYRLSDPGIIKGELKETLANSKAVVVIEWSDIVQDVLPAERLRIEFRHTEDERRQTSYQAHGQRYQDLIRELQ